MSEPNVYSFSFKTLQGDRPLPLADYQGKVILIVNTASKCGFTRQYSALEALYQQYQDRGLVILAVPSNDFGHQEPGNAETIANFCKIHYGVSFPVTAKISVRGKDAHPFYQFAREKEGFWGSPKWNFHKYLVNRKGELIDYFYPFTTPTAKRFVKAIEKALA